MKKLLISILIMSFLFFAINSFAQNTYQVTFAWNYDAQVPVQGFKLYQREKGSSYNYSVPIATIANPDARECSIKSVPEGASLYWVLRAYDGYNESPDSNEVYLEYVGIPGAPGGFKVKGILIEVIP